MGQAPRAVGSDGIFVVQRHDGSSLHYDVRLQVGDVLVSWAVPKGPSLDPRTRRLAVRTADHALDHATFEGRTGTARGGVGTVIVWDSGEFVNLTMSGGARLPASDALEAGHLKVALRGTKLAGAFALTRTAMGGDQRNWLLVKVDDQDADTEYDPASTDLRSVLSGRSNDDLAAPHGGSDD